MNRLKNSLALLSTSSTGGAAAAATADDEDHEQRRTIVSTRRDVLDSVKATSTLYHKHWSKRRPDPRSSSSSSLFKTNKDQQQQLATKWFSLALADVASLEPRSHDSGYYSIVSDCLSKVDDISVRYVGRFEREFVDPLDRRIDQCRTFEHSVKRLDKKRDQFRKLKHSSESDNNKSVDSKKRDDSVQHELEQLEWEVTDATDDVDRQFREIQLAAARDDVESLKNLIEAQLEFAKAWTTVLERARDEFDKHHHDHGNDSNATYCSTATTIDDDDGATRSRATPSAATSSSIASTRMNRSHSDSSGGGGGGRLVMSGVATGATNLLSSLGPGRRSRRSTVSTSSSDHDKGNNAMNRSRSGSVLERFALGSSSSKGDGDRVSSSSDRTEPVVGESKNRSRSGSGSSKWTSSPSLASLARMKPFGSSASPSSPSSSSPSSKRYGALRDDDGDELSPYARGVGRLGRDDDDDGSGAAAALVALDPYREPEAPSSTTATTPKRRPPPPLHRTRTAPPATTTTTTTPRRLSPIGQTFVAKWSFDPTRTGGRGDDELKLDKGDLVVVEDVVNRDWWIGRLVEGEGEGETRRGMFPSLYVALHEEEEEETTTDDDDEQGLVAAKSPFE